MSGVSVLLSHRLWAVLMFFILEFESHKAVNLSAILSVFSPRGTLLGS